jgi:hypothetical protein
MANRIEITGDQNSVKLEAVVETETVEDLIFALFETINALSNGCGNPDCINCHAHQPIGDRRH